MRLFSITAVVEGSDEADADALAEQIAKAIWAEDYPVPNRFTGEVNWVEIDVGAAAADGDHHIDPDELLRVAMARQ